MKKKIVYGKRLHMNPCSIFYKDESAHAAYLCFSSVYAMRDQIREQTLSHATRDVLLTLENSSEATPLSILLLGS